MRLRLVLATLLLCVATVGWGQYAARTTDAKGEKAKLQRLAAAQKQAEAVYRKSPRNAAAKKAYVRTTVDLGYETMMSPVLDRREKYKVALRHFRAALKVDPGNKKARESKDTIESIYRSMGRPIPPV